MPTSSSHLFARYRPTQRDELARFVQTLLDLRVPDRALIPGHDAPLDYLTHVFFEDSSSSGDCVVWANRGGGKTCLGALATLLDLLFKPGIQVRILGGSLEQSSRMYAYLRDMLLRPGLRTQLAAPPTRRRIALRNGSAAEILAQSQRSVRGTHVHKLRCDEVEEFDPQIWRAAQMVPRSGPCGPIHVRGSLEALSTLHRPSGLMSQLLSHTSISPPPESNTLAGQAPLAGPVSGPLPGTGAGRLPGAEAGARRIFRWSALDVAQPCPPWRDCRSCPLLNDCQGRLRHAVGFMPINDLIRQQARSSAAAWASEMLCLQPRLDACVYPQFDSSPGGRHVAPAHAALALPGVLVLGGIDFGIRSPFVMLWALLEPGPQPAADRRLCVMDEYVRTDATLEQNLAALAQRPWPPPAWVGVDPAGAQRNSHSGLSDIQTLRFAGHHVRAARATISQGVERVRRRLDRSALRIDPRCALLIQALTQYHFDPGHAQDPNPVKDGPDHLCDALRYLVINVDAASPADERPW